MGLRITNYGLTVLSRVNNAELFLFETNVEFIFVIHNMPRMFFISRPCVLISLRESRKILQATPSIVNAELMKE